MKQRPIKNVTFKVPVSIFLQGSSFVAYTPALDISTYGKSKKEAQKNFEELVDTFFSSFQDTRQLAQVLESLGWIKKKTTWHPPKIEQQRISVPASLVAA